MLGHGGERAQVVGGALRLTKEHAGQARLAEGDEPRSQGAIVARGDGQQGREEHREGIWGPRGRSHVADR